MLPLLANGIGVWVDEKAQEFRSGFLSPQHDPDSLDVHGVMVAFGSRMYIDSCPCMCSGNDSPGSSKSDAVDERSVYHCGIRAHSCGLRQRLARELFDSGIATPEKAKFLTSSFQIFARCLEPHVSEKHRGKKYEPK